MRSGLRGSRVSKAAPTARSSRAPRQNDIAGSSLRFCSKGRAGRYRARIRGVALRRWRTGIWGASGDGVRGAGIAVTGLARGSFEATWSMGLGAGGNQSLRGDRWRGEEVIQACVHTVTRMPERSSIPICPPGRVGSGDGKIGTDGTATSTSAKVGSAGGGTPVSFPDPHPYPGLSPPRVHLPATDTVAFTGITNRTASP